jgi:hypothetical protein
MSDKKQVKKDILSRLDKINSKNLTKIYIPSLEKEVDFKPFTIKHQKQLLESSIDNVLFNIQYKLASYDIIKELSTENIVDLINVIDRDVIFFQLRYHSIGKMWGDHDLTEKFESIPNYNFVDLKPEEYSSEDILIPIFLPTLKYENDFLKEFVRMHNLSNLDVQNMDELRKQTGLLYFTEIYKYMSRIIFKEDEFMIDFQSKEWSLRDKFEIVYGLDKEILEKVQDCIKNYNEKLRDFLTLGENVIIDIGPDFFQ